LRKKTNKPKGFSVRETRVAQISIFENYSKHEFGVRLKTLSHILDKHPEILTIIETDLINTKSKKVGRKGLSVESIFRCLLLKQQLNVSYEKLAFHLSDSMSYRTFARLPNNLSPGKSALQSTIRRIEPKTLEQIHQLLCTDWLKSGNISLEKLRIDSTVVKSNIAPPSDSQLLNDGIRVLSRYLAKSREDTGVKIRFTDQRKKTKSLTFAIFNAKSAIKEALYPELLKLVRLVLKQVDRALIQIKNVPLLTESQKKWVNHIEHYRDLTLKIMGQTERRIINKENVPSSEKIVSLFEPHSDIIIKGFRDIQYGHKINLSTEKSGFVTYLSIEDGNPSDKSLFLPVLNAHQDMFSCLPQSTVADGGYASKVNVTLGREMGIQRVVFHKRVGISLHAMGVKTKTFERLRNFRAGIEGNISELKRAFGLSKAKWKGHDGFKAFVWSSVITYNLLHLARIETG
jgi:IS5 family transposase